MHKQLKVFLIILLTLLVVSVLFVGGCVADNTPSQNQTGLELVDQAWNAIVQNYVEPAKINSDNLSRGAVKGIMDALNDPYSAYLDPETYKLFQSDLQGKFEGIGAEVALNSDAKPVIIAPLDQSPAAKAGIKTGDIILAVNGKPTDGMSLVEVVLNVRGPAGTSVTLTILHEGDTVPVDIEIVRTQIESPSVNWEMKGDIAYIRIFQFGERTNDEFNSALQSIDLKNTAGIILDLRSNPGRLVPAVVDVASHFIKEGVVLTLVNNKGERTSESVHPNGVFTDLPMVVLVDQYSASGTSFEKQQKREVKNISYFL